MTRAHPEPALIRNSKRFHSDRPSRPVFKTLVEHDQFHEQRQFNIYHLLKPKLAPVLAVDSMTCRSTEAGIGPVDLAAILGNILLLVLSDTTALIWPCRRGLFRLNIRFRPHMLNLSKKLKLNIMKVLSLILFLGD
jgi:hypothetical protein